MQFAVQVCMFLNEHFPNCIRRDGCTLHPPTFPDFTLMDFSVWSLLKDQVFFHRVPNVKRLKTIITQKLNFINENHALLQWMVRATAKH